MCVTLDNSVISNEEGVLGEDLINNCPSEEADPRLIRHAINLGKRGYMHIHVKTVDTDVVVLSGTGTGVSQFFIDFGNGRFFDILEISLELGEDICKGLPFFHTLSGCDTTSSLLRKQNPSFGYINGS